MTANPAQGIRVEWNGPVRLTAAGRIALPLSVDHDGEHIGHGELVMTYDDATRLHAELRRVVTAHADCRDETHD